MRRLFTRYNKQKDSSRAQGRGEKEVNMVEFGTYNPNSYTVTGNYVTPIASCVSLGKVHHFHRQKIECLDIKTINSEDLPLIEVCCRCQFEQEIQKTQIISRKSPVKKMVVNPMEVREADAVLKAYNERRTKRIQDDVLRFAKK